ncbi:unnamed protein product [Coregonus sp. 'balchen']|nr:unnamed protein product [Coregonus sp. 'balchen']
MEEKNVRKSKGRRRQLLADHSYTGEKPPPDSSGEEMEESGHSSIEELKCANTATSDKCTAQEKTIGDMQERMSEAERYRRRWGLRLYGVPEDQGENVKRIVSDCNRV